MSVRQRVLHSAPLIGFALAIVFLGLSLAGYVILDDSRMSHSLDTSSI